MHKPLLINGERPDRATLCKQAQAGQQQRLSEEAAETRKRQSDPGGNVGTEAETTSAPANRLVIK